MKKLFITLLIFSYISAWEFTQTNVSPLTNYRESSVNVNYPGYQQLTPEEQATKPYQYGPLPTSALLEQPSSRDYGILKLSEQTQNIGPNFKAQIQSTIPLDKPTQLIPITPMSPDFTAPYPLEKRYKP